MRKKDAQLKDTILDIAKDLIKTEGPDAVSIRKIAERAGIASGTVYNYFSDKNDIMLSLTDEYWQKALADMQSKLQHACFTGQLQEFYYYLHRQNEDSNGIFIGSLNQASVDGHAKIRTLQKRLCVTIIRQLQLDKSIPSAVWTSTFRTELFADFIASNLMLHLRQNATDIHFLVEIVNRALYTEKELVPYGR